MAKMMTKMATKTTHDDYAAASKPRVTLPMGDGVELTPLSLRISISRGLTFGMCRGRSPRGSPPRLTTMGANAAAAPHASAHWSCTKRKSPILGATFWR